MVLTGCEIVEFGPNGPAETPSKDEQLTGTQVDVSAIPAGIRKVFMLNEGGMAPTMRRLISCVSVTGTMSQVPSGR